MSLVSKFNKTSLDQLDEKQLNEVLEASKEVLVPKAIVVLEAVVKKTSTGGDERTTNYQDFSQVIAWYKHRGATIIRSKTHLVVLYYDTVLVYGVDKVRE